MSKQTELVGLARTTTLDEVNAAYSAGALSNRNLIINGAMQIAQRGTSSSPVPVGYLIDRFATYQNGATIGTVDIAQSSDAPDGFTKSALITVTATGTPTGADYRILQHVLEGNNFSVLSQGTAAAKTFTLSFWVKTSILGTFSGSVRNGAATHSYVFEYTMNAINTWEYKTVTIVGTTSGAFATDNTAAANIVFSQGQGTTYATATVGSWVVGNFHGSTTETDLVSNSGATWQITGVQLEVGPATPFEHRSYGQELALCQRYYTKLGAGGPYMRFGSGFNYLSTVNNSIVHLPTSMRTVGTLTTSGASTFAIYHSGGSVSTCAGITLDTSGGSLTVFNINGTTSGLTIGGAGLLIAQNNDAAYLAIDAEL